MLQPGSERNEDHAWVEKFAQLTDDQGTACLQQRPLLAEQLEQVLDERAKMLLRRGSHVGQCLDVEPYDILRRVREALEERGPDLRGELHDAWRRLAKQHVHPTKRGQQRADVIGGEVSVQSPNDCVHLGVSVVGRL